MSNIYVLYNPLSGGGMGEGDSRLLDFAFPKQAHYFDVLKITNYSAFLGGMEDEDILVIAGGDGTLNRFANDTAGIDIRQKILFFPIGSGNDFARDLGKPAYCQPFPVTEYLKDLPTVEVKGKSCRFLNGVGFGIDGYCCREGEMLRSHSRQRVNYTSIAVKGLLFHFSPRRAVVTVDGQKYTYDKVWLAPAMFGKYYGGGMIPAPEQSRDDPEKKITLMLFHGAGRLRALCAFPGIFKGSHTKHKNIVSIHSGHEITVEFDRPTPLQIDGETVLDAESYTARSTGCNVKEQKRILLKTGEPIV